MSSCSSGETLATPRRGRCLRQRETVEGLFSGTLSFGRETCRRLLGKVFWQLGPHFSTCRCLPRPHGILHNVSSSSVFQLRSAWTVFFFLSSSESEEVCSLLTGLNDDSGILSWLGVVDFEEDFALLLKFMTAHLFQFRFADSYWLITLTSTLSQVTIVSQGYLDELASDGKTAPKAAIAESSTFRIKCGDDGFRHVSFDVSHQSGTRDLHRARTKVPCVPHTGDNFASISSVLTKCPFREMPNSSSCDVQAPPDCPLHTGVLGWMPSTTPPQTYDACRVSW